MVDRLQPPQPEWECLRVGPVVGFVMRRTPLLQPSHWVGPNGRLYALDPTGQGPLGAFWVEEGAAYEPAAVARLNKPSYRLTPGERATHLRPLPAQRHVAQEQAQGLEQGGARAEEWLLGPWAHLQLVPHVWGMGTTTLLDFSVKHARVRLHQLQRVSADPLYPPCGGLWPAMWGVRPPRAAGEPEVAAVADGALRELELKWEASAQQVADQGAAGGAHQRPSPQIRADQQAERQLEAQQRRGGRQPLAQPAPRADTVDQLAVGDQAGQPCAKVWKELLDPTLRWEHVIVAWRVLHASLMIGALWGHILKGAAAPGSSACRFCQPGHLETLTHAFLTCPAVVPAREWVLDVYGRLTGTRPPSGDAMLLHSGRPTCGEAPPFQPPDSLLWLRLRVAYLGAVWRLRSSGAATALQPQQVARRVVEEVISTLTTAVKRDWHRVGRDIRVGLCGAVPSTWFKGKDPELDAAHFDQLWPEANPGQGISYSVQFHLGLLEYLQQLGQPSLVVVLDLAGAYDNVSTMVKTATVFVFACLIVLLPGNAATFWDRLINVADTTVATGQDPLGAVTGPAWVERDMIGSFPTEFAHLQVCNRPQMTRTPQMAWFPITYSRSSLNGRDAEMPMSVCHHQVDNKTQETQALQDAIRQPDRRHRNAIPQLAKKGICCIDRGPCTCAQRYTTRSSNWLATSTKHPHTHSNQPEDELPNDQPRPPREPTLHALHADLLPRTRHPHTHSNQTEDEQPHDQPRPLRGTPLHASHADLLPLTELHVTEMPTDHADMQDDNKHGAQPHHHLPALPATALQDQLAVTEMPTDHADMQADNRHGAQPHHHLPALTATDLHGQLAVTEMPPNHADMQADNRHGAQPHHHLPALPATALQDQLAVTEMPTDHADMQADNRHGAQPHHHLPALTATDLQGQLAVTEMPTDHDDMQADNRHGAQPHHHLPALTATDLHGQLAVTEMPPNHADMQADNRHGAQPHHHLPALPATALQDQLAVTEMPTDHADMQADNRHGAQPHHHLPALTATDLQGQLAVTEMPTDHDDMQADNRHGAQPHHHLPALTATDLHGQLAVTEMPPNHADMQADSRHGAQPHHHLPALTATDLLGQLAVTEMPPNHADMQADNRHGAQPHHHLPALPATALHGQLAVTEMPPNHADMQADNRHGAQPHHHLPALPATALQDQLAVTEMPTDHADMQADNRHGAQPHHHLPALTATDLHGQLAVTEMPPNHADMQADSRHGAQPHHHLPALTATDLHDQLAVTEMPTDHADMQANNRHDAQPHHHLPALTATDLLGQLAVTEMPPNHADMQADNRHGAQPHHHLPALTATALQDQLAVTEMPPNHADMQADRATFDISIAGHCLNVLDSAGRSALSPNLHRCTTPEALVLSLTTLAKDAAPALTIINTSHSTSRYTPSRNLTATRCAVTFTCSAPAEQYREAMQQALMLGRKVHNFTHLLKGGTVRYGGAAACQGIPDLRHAPLAEQVQTLMQLTGTSLTKTHAGNLTTPAETATFLSRASLEAARLDCLAVRVRSAGDNKVLIQSNSQAIQQANASLVNSNGELKGHIQLLVPNLFCITLRPERQPGQQYSLNVDGIPPERRQDTAALSTVLIAIHTNIGVGIGKLLKAPALAPVVSQNPGLRNSLVDSIRFLAFTGAEVGFHAAITNPTHVFTTASGQALAHATTAELRGTRPRENQLLMADNASLALVSLSLACTPEVGTIKAEGMTLSISVGSRRSPPPDRSTAASILATAAGAVQSGITLPPPAGCEGIHTRPLSLVKITELPTATLLPNLVHIFKHTIPTALSLPGATPTRHALVVAEQDSTYADLLEGLSTLDDSTIDAAVQQALPSSAPAAGSGRDMGRGPGRGVSSKGRGRASASGNARQPQQPTQVAWARHEGNPAGHAPEDEDHLGTMGRLVAPGAMDANPTAQATSYQLGATIMDPPQAGGTTGTAHLPGEELSNLPGRTMPGTTGGLVWGARRVAADARDPLAAPLSAERAAQRPRMSTVHLASSRSLEQQLTAAGTPRLETGPLPASEDAKMADGEAYVTYSINPHTTYTIDNIKRLTMGAINYLTHIGWLLLAAGDIEPNPGPEGPYFEKQVAHHCQIHALNMVVGHPWLSNQDLANFHTSELNARQGDQMWALARDEEGACNDTVVNLYLTSHYGLSTHTVAHLKTGRDWSTRHLDALAEAHGITAFLCKAPAHSMAIRKHNDTWYLLDSEATTPTPLQVTGNRAYHAACEIQTITTISHPTAAMTAARTRARLGPIISTTRHTFTAAAVCIGARPGPTNPRKTHMPYWESQHKKCCLVHAINMAMGEPMINPEDVITHCKTLDTHIQDLATKARQEHRQIPLHNNLPHIYHDQGNFTISTINHYLYHYHKDLHLCPTTQELPYGSITRELLTGTTGKPDSHTNTVAAILFTDNHATTIRHMDNAWHWLDSERGHPQRLDTPAAWSQLHGRLVQIRKGTAQNTNLIEPLCWLADPTTRATTEQLEQHLRTTYVDLTNLGRDTPAHSPHADRPTPRTDTHNKRAPSAKTRHKRMPTHRLSPPSSRQTAKQHTRLPFLPRNATLHGPHHHVPPVAAPYGDLNPGLCLETRTRRLQYAEVNTRCVILTLRQHKCEELTIVATYWPSGDNDDAIPLREKMQEHIRTTTERAPGSLILAGDINATMRKEDRYGHTEYTQDRMMRKFADKLLLFEADPGDRAWTYQQPHCNSRIDAILTRDARHGSEHRTHVDTHAYLSDHRPLTATLTTARLGINLAAIRKPQQQCHTVLTTPITNNDREAYRLAVQQPSSGAPQLHARLTAYLAPMYTEATHFLATLDKANPHQPQRLAQVAGLTAREAVDTASTMLTTLLETCRRTAMQTCNTKTLTRGGQHYQRRTMCRIRLALGEKLKTTRNLCRQARLLFKQNGSHPTIGDLIPETDTTNAEVREAIQARQGDDPTEDHVPAALAKLTNSYRDQIHQLDDDDSALAIAQARVRMQQLISNQPKKANKHILRPSRTDHKGLQALSDPDTKKTCTAPADLNRIITAAYGQKLTPPNPKTGHYTNTLTRNYPWARAKADDPFSMHTCKNIHWLHTAIMDKAGFQECLSRLAGGKAPGPDGIENEIIKMLPWEMRDTIHQLFIIMWATGCTPTAWKTSDTCLLYKDKGQETDLNAYRPVGLANTIYKLWTSLITKSLYEYAEANGMLSNCQAGFRSHRDTTQQLQMLVMALEDAKLAKTDIYALLVDFTSAFNTTCQDKLLWIMHDLGFPTDATDAVKDLYTGATTRFKTPYGHTDPVPVDRGTIQGDSLSPFLFLIYIEPLLRWLQVGARGYKFTSETTDSAGRFTIGSIDYADDIAILCNSISNLRCQADKLSADSDWGHLIISHSKTLATAALHKAHQSGRCSTLADAEKQARRELQHVRLQGKPVTYLPPTAPFAYLGVLLTMTLNWKPQHMAMAAQLKQKLERLRRSFASARQAIHIIKTAIIPSLAYSFCVVPCTPGDLDLYDRAVNQCIKKKLRLPLGTTNAVIREDIDKLGLGISSTAQEYHARNTTALMHSLQSADDTHAHITRSMLHKQITWLYAQAAKHGHRMINMLQHTLRARQLLHATTAQLKATHQGEELYPKETKLLGQLITQDNSPLPHDIVNASITCLKSLGIKHAYELQQAIAEDTYIISGKMLKDRFGNKVKQKHYIALNKLAAMASQDKCPTAIEAKAIADTRDTTLNLPAAQRKIKHWAAGLTELAPIIAEEDSKHRYADIRSYAVAKQPPTQPPAQEPTAECAHQPDDTRRRSSRLRNKALNPPPATPQPKPPPKIGSKRQADDRHIQTIPEDVIHIPIMTLDSLPSWKANAACERNAKELGITLGAMYDHQESITKIDGWHWNGINKESYYNVHWGPTIIEKWALQMCKEEGYTPMHTEDISRADAKHACTCELCWEPIGESPMCNSCMRAYHPACLAQTGLAGKTANNHWLCPVCAYGSDDLKGDMRQSAATDLLQVHWHPTTEPKALIQAHIDYTAKQKEYDAENNRRQGTGRPPPDAGLPGHTRQGLPDPHTWLPRCIDLHSKAIFQVSPVNPQTDIVGTGRCETTIQQHAHIITPATSEGSQGLTLPQYSLPTHLVAHDEAGRTVGLITKSKQQDLATWLQHTPHPRDHATELVALLRRHDTHNTPQPIQAAQDLAISTLYTTHHFPSTVQRWANPLTVRAETTTYWSPDINDTAYGAHHNSTIPLNKPNAAVKSDKHAKLTIYIVWNRAGQQLVTHGNPQGWLANTATALHPRIRTHPALAKPSQHNQPTPLPSGHHKHRGLPADHELPSTGHTRQTNQPASQPTTHAQRAIPEWKKVTYTDGSCIKGTEGASVGAGVYTPASDDRNTIALSGDTTINRAELIAILSALQVGAKRIATDSLCSLYQIRRALANPMSLRTHRHKDILAEIASILTNSQDTVHFFKVRAHSGIIGNEGADALAKHAARHPEQATTRGPCNPRHTEQHAWLSTTSDLNVTTPLPDCRHSVRAHMSNKHKLGLANQESTYYQMTREITKAAAKGSCERVMTDAGIPTEAQRTALLYRTGGLYNQKLAMRWGKAADDRCPLCGEADSATHLLSGCSRTAGLVQERHNGAGRLIVKAISKGAQGGCIKFADIGSHERGETEGIELPSATLRKALEDLSLSARDTNTTTRPDIIMINNTKKRKQGSNASTKHVTLLEIKYCADSRWAEQLDNATTQHAAMAEAIIAAGHTVRWWEQAAPQAEAPPLIHAGSAGVVFFFFFFFFFGRSTQDPKPELLSVFRSSPSASPASTQDQPSWPGCGGAESLDGKAITASQPQVAATPHQRTLAGGGTAGLRNW
ncbi:hypothetical protein QJQ45_002695 [Haematococcus lacustris]|nr:hypothetical protein QJQ45_002695 [Haematococcus lacustris]